MYCTILLNRAQYGVFGAHIFHLGIPTTKTKADLVPLLAKSASGCGDLKLFCRESPGTYIEENAYFK